MTQPQEPQPGLPSMVGQLVGSLTGNFLLILEKRDQAAKDTLALLSGIKSGEIDLARLIVTDDGWRLMPPPPTPSANSNKKEKVTA